MFLVINFLFASLFADGSYSTHLSELAGFEKSLKDAQTQCEKLKNKFKEKNLTANDKKILRSEMRGIDNSMKIYTREHKKLVSHIRHIHTKDYKNDFINNKVGNKRKEKADLSNNRCLPY